jgi:hypothetical protein
MNEPKHVTRRVQHDRTIAELDRVAWNLPDPKPDQEPQPSHPAPVVASAPQSGSPKESGH